MVQDSLAEPAALATGPKLHSLEKTMKPLVAACCAVFLTLTPCAAEEAPQTQLDKPLVLVLPANTDDCLKTLEAVLERALSADLLEDQLDEAEGKFDKLETACIDGRFPEALEHAQAIEKLVAMNK